VLLAVNAIWKRPAASEQNRTRRSVTYIHKQFVRPDCTRCRHKKAGSLPHEIPTPNSQDPLAGPCAEQRHSISNRSRPCAGSNRSSSQLTLLIFWWARLPESTGHTCPPSLAVPHRSVTWSVEDDQDLDLEAMSRPPLEQVPSPTPQPYTSCRPLKRGRTSRVDTRG